MTIWIYVDTRYRVGHPDHIKAFADPEAAERWFRNNEQEGVAFQYEIIDPWKMLVPARILDHHDPSASVPQPYARSSETKHGATRRGGRKDANVASFTKETAAKTGKSVRAVALDATRAKRLGSDLDRVAGMSLDKGSETVNVAGRASSA
jgi:hypothetical protein